MRHDLDFGPDCPLCSNPAGLNRSPSAITPAYNASVAAAIAMGGKFFMTAIESYATLYRAAQREDELCAPSRDRSSPVRENSAKPDGIRPAAPAPFSCMSTAPPARPVVRCLHPNPSACPNLTPFRDR